MYRNVRIKKKKTYIKKVNLFCPLLLGLEFLVMLLSTAICSFLDFIKFTFIILFCIIVCHQFIHNVLFTLLLCHARREELGGAFDDGTDLEIFGIGLAAHLFVMALAIQDVTHFKHL